MPRALDLSLFLLTFGRNCRLIDPVRAYRLVMLTGPPRLLEIRVVSPTPLLPPAYAYSDSPLADDSDLEPDPGLTWIDSDEESDTDTELTSPASDADLDWVLNGCSSGARLHTAHAQPHVRLRHALCVGVRRTI